MMAAVTKADLANKISKDFGLSISESKSLVHIFFTTITSSLTQEQYVQVTNFMRAKIIISKQRIGYNFTNKRKAIIPQKIGVLVKLSSYFR